MLSPKVPIWRWSSTNWDFLSIQLYTHVGWSWQIETMSMYNLLWVQKKTKSFHFIVKDLRGRWTLPSDPCFLDIGWVLTAPCSRVDLPQKGEAIHSLVSQQARQMDGNGEFEPSKLNWLIHDFLALTENGAHSSLPTANLNMLIWSFMVTWLLILWFSYLRVVFIACPNTQPREQSFWQIHECVKVDSLLTVQCMPFSVSAKKHNSSILVR